MKIRTYEGFLVEMEKVEEHMDAEIRDNLPLEQYFEVSNQELYEMYCVEHLEKYGEEFIVY